MNKNHQHNQFIPINYADEYVKTLPHRYPTANPNPNIINPITPTIDMLSSYILRGMAQIFI